MKYNPLVPELSVRNLETSLNFYVRGVGFSVAYTRSDPPFAYLDLNGAQLMLEEDHKDAWVTGSLAGPLVQLEYLAQDPDGYLIRLVQRLST